MDRGQGNVGGGTGWERWQGRVRSGEFGWEKGKGM